MRLINASRLKNCMIASHEYHGDTSQLISALERDIRIIDEQPTVDVFAELEKELKNLKIRQNSENTDYYTGYISAVSTIEGIIAELKEKYESENL
jgi:ribosome-associated translation inhibitor RaiA